MAPPMIPPATTPGTKPPPRQPQPPPRQPQPPQRRNCTVSIDGAAAVRRPIGEDIGVADAGAASQVAAEAISPMITNLHDLLMRSSHLCLNPPPVRVAATR